MCKSALCLTLRRFAVCIFPLLLGACGIFSQPEPVQPVKVKHVHHEQPALPPKIVEAIEYPPDAYLQHLSLAQLTLQAKTGAPDAAAADLDIARSYALQHQEGTASPSVIIMEYAGADEQKRSHVAIPFAMPANSADFPELEEAMVRLNALSYTLYDLKLGVITLPQLMPLGDEGEDVASTQGMIDASLQPLISAAVPLPPMVQARVNLQLARFFMKHQYREPAYIAIENAKQSLATVDTTTGDSEATHSLSRDIDTQESLLHKTMPFTLGF